MPNNRNHWTITDADRDDRGRIMADAQQRAAAREAAAAPAPEAPAEPTAPRQRKLSNRRGAPAPEAPAAIRPQLGRHTYEQLIGSVLIIAAMGGLAAWALGRSSSSTPAVSRATAPAGMTTAPADRPAAAPPASSSATVDAYASPGGALLGPIPADTQPAYRDSRRPGWAGVDWQGAIVWIEAEPPAAARDLAPPTPAPRPQIIYVEPSPIPCDPAINPLYRVQEDVYDGARPLGQVTGVSCDSQQDAQSNADAAAAAMRAAQPTAAPEPTKTAIVPRPPARPKPLQPPVTHDSGQSDIEIALWAAGWPVAALKGVLPWRSF